jgi:hypothetical protein
MLCLPMCRVAGRKAVCWLESQDELTPGLFRGLYVGSVGRSERSLANVAPLMGTSSSRNL